MSQEKKYSSVIDTPKQATDKDAFGMDKYKNGLISFIEKTNTPITIALQGEWGSGKTSLMNTLKNELCDEEGKRFHPVWINTWQYSLMKEANQTLVSIIKGLTEEVVELTKNKNSDNIKKLSSVFGKVFKASAKVALKTTTGIDTDSIIDAFAPENKEVTVLQLRNALNNAINDIISEGHKDAFIFFIDDLDRIDPPVAVEILELLKNIFDLENCVFVLAIDYDVIIKGLEPKFGKFTEKNEREFRSFFDKIIQLPFSMPVANYDIDDFLVENLEAIDYLDNKQKEDVKFKASISEITRLSVGSNPRALKRLLNSLSLINSINKGLNEDNEYEGANANLDKIINFALVNIQIAYPQIYSLLVQYPDFVGWDDKIAIQMNLPAIDDNIIEKLNNQEEFDEDWEKVLFRVCEKDFFLKKKALNISRLLNKVRSIIEEAKENTEEVIASVISLSSVTNLEAFDKPIADPIRGYLLKDLRNKVIVSLRNKMSELSEQIVPVGRVVKKANIKVINYTFQLHTHPIEGNKIRLIIKISKEFDISDDKKYEEIIVAFRTEIDNLDNLESCNIDKKKHYYNYVILDDAELFFKEDIINTISVAISKTYSMLNKISKL